MSVARPFALDPAGPEAAPVATLSWALFAGGTLILLLVLAMIAIALAGPRRWRAWLARERIVLALGFVFPIAVLSVLLVIGLSMTASLASSTRPAGALTVRVTGEQWWWRIDYPGFETANELVIPVGRPVHVELASNDVIHSLWVPQLGGKRDLIPGRINRLNLEADRPGTYFGICAEYCGGPHALMQFRVHALPADEYRRWEAAQREPAPVPEAAAAISGARHFQALGCGVCHTVRGTEADGDSGPDLTHLATRTTIAAGVLPMSRENLARWTEHAEAVKPGNLMPPYRYLPEEELSSVVAYLATLR